MLVLTITTLHMVHLLLRSRTMRFQRIFEFYFWFPSGLLIVLRRYYVDSQNSNTPDVSLLELFDSIRFLGLLKWQYVGSPIPKHQAG